MHDIPSPHSQAFLNLAHISDDDFEHVAQQFIFSAQKDPGHETVVAIMLETDADVRFDACNNVESGSRLHFDSDSDDDSW